MDSFGPDDVDTAAETRLGHRAVDDGTVDEFQERYSSRQKKMVLLALALLLLFLGLCAAYLLA